MKICKIFCVILTLNEVSPLPAKRKTRDVSGSEDNPNLKIFPAYGEYPSAIEEIGNPIIGEKKADEEDIQQLEAQETETDSYIIRKVLPKAYKVATVAEEPRVLTAYYKNGKPVIPDPYAKVVQKVLIDDDDITARSVPFYENGSGIANLLINDRVVAEKTPLKIQVVEGGPVIYQSDVVRINGELLPVRQQRAYIEPTTIRVADPIILRLNDGQIVAKKSDDAIFSYYQCQTIDTGRPALCSKEPIKTVRASRALGIPSSLYTTLPQTSDEVVISTIARESRGGKWKDYITYSLESNIDPIEVDQFAEEDRIDEVKTTLRGEAVNDDKNNIDDGSKPGMKSNCDRNHSQHDANNKSGTEMDKKEQKVNGYQRNNLLIGHPSVFSNPSAELRNRHQNLRKKINLGKFRNSDNLIGGE